MKNLDEVEFFTAPISLESANKNSRNSKILVNDEFEMDAVNEKKLELIIREERINDIRWLNKYFEEVNRALKIGGVFKGNVETFSVRRQRILNKFPSSFNRIYLFLDILLTRVSPKIWITKNLYFHITKGKGRVLSKAETFGRLYSCGFEIVDEEVKNGRLYFTVKKVKEPVFQFYYVLSCNSLF